MKLSTLLFATSASATSLLLPLYSSPGDDGSAWASVQTALSGNSNINATIVINVSNGPGGSDGPDAGWIAGGSALASLPNVKLAGYVHCSRCQRPAEEVKADVAAWAAWREHGVDVAGIFVDEAPNDGSCADYMRDLTEHARGLPSLGGNDAAVVYNPGFPAAPHSLDAYYALDPTYISALETCFAAESNGEDLCDGAYEVYDAAGYGSTVDATLEDWVGVEHYARTAVLVHGFHGSNGMYEADDGATLVGALGALVDRGMGAAVFTTNHWLTPDALPADIVAVADSLDMAHSL